MRKVSDGWEKEEDENVDGRGGGGDLVGVRGANASLEISALRRLVSLGHRRGEEGGGLIAPFPPAAAAAESQWQIQLPFWTTERFSQREAPISRMDVPGDDSELNSVNGTILNAVWEMAF